MKTALLLIDLQNDYFPGGKYPLWNTDAVLGAAEAAIDRARQEDTLVVHVQHVAADAAGPFFHPGSEGSRIHPRILAAAPEAPVVEKRFADAFHRTRLGTLLGAHGIERLELAGMMTQNCIAHTALSRGSDPYAVAVLADATTSIDAMIHRFALNALATRVEIHRMPAGD